MTPLQTRKSFPLSASPHIFLPKNGESRLEFSGLVIPFRGAIHEQPQTNRTQQYADENISSLQVKVAPKEPLSVIFMTAIAGALFFITYKYLFSSTIKSGEKFFGALVMGGFGAAFACASFANGLASSDPLYQLIGFAIGMACAKGFASKMSRVQ